MSAISIYPNAVIAYLLEIPATGPPPGVEAVSTENINTWTPSLFVAVFCMLISTVALAVRCYTKAMLIKEWFVEDTLLVISWILLIYFTIDALQGGVAGMNRHMWNMTLGQFFAALYYVNVGAIVYCVVVMLIKDAILLQYLRIFCPNHHGSKALRWTIYTWIALITVFYFVIMWFAIFQCYPREAYWNPYVKGSCISWQASSQAVCIFTVISDFALLFIPIFPVLKLHTATKRKVLIGMLFGIGFLDCFASIMRTYYTWRMTDGTDISWEISLMCMWSWLEMAFGIVVACLPVSPRFLKYFKQRSSMLLKRISRINIDVHSSSTSHSGSGMSRRMSRKTDSYHDLEAHRKAIQVYEMRVSDQTLPVSTPKSPTKSLTFEEPRSPQRVFFSGRDF